AYCSACPTTLYRILPGNYFRFIEQNTKPAVISFYLLTIVIVQRLNGLSFLYCNKTVKKMRTVIVFNHPNEGSYCNAILQSVTKGLQNANHEVDLMHLDNDGFNPAMSKADLKAFVDHQPIDPQVVDYNERLKKADH